MDWGLAVGACSALVALLAFIRTSRRDNKRDAIEQTQGYSEMRGDVKYIRDSIDDLKVDQKVMQKEMSALNLKVVQIEAAANRANERIDEHLKHEHKEG